MFRGYNVKQDLGNKPKLKKTSPVLPVEKKPSLLDAKPKHVLKGSPPAEKGFFGKYKKRMILLMIAVSMSIFAYNMYEHYTVFSYNNIIRKVNNMQVIDVKDLERIEREFPEDAPAIMRSAMANLIQSTTDPKKRLALEVQQYWDPKIYIITQKDGTEIVVGKEISVNQYKEMISRCDALIEKWDKYALDAPMWRATRDKRVLRFSRNTEGFSIPYPLLNTFSQLYPLPGVGQASVPSQ